ncbi:hypothetical protein PJI16_07585 [Nitrospira sp. MA-1]|nr:hypothetical protein [Nitrospira sp. MA-1]
MNETHAMVQPLRQAEVTMGLLKKAASGVLVILPCSRTGGMLCAQK